MGTLLVVLLALGTLAFVGYPLVQGIRESKAPLPELDVEPAYADAEALELDFRTGKVAEEEYEALRSGAASSEADDDIERKIKALRAQRRRKPETAGVASAGKCPECGTRYDTGDQFCAKCGASLSQSRACRNCGTPYDPGDRFCVKCGKPL